MEASEDVLIIGTDPPCPRCDLLALKVEEVASELGKAVSVRHCSYTSEDAAAVGRNMNRQVGTAKHVSEEAGVPVDWDAVYQLVEEKTEAAGADARPADAWTPELDALLDPCREAADEAGFLMTPVLVLNGTVKHQGSVPTREQITEWLLSA